MSDTSKSQEKRTPIVLMDTTLRDGEQTHGVSIPGHEKLIVAQHLISSLKVDRIEVASCRVSQGEQKSLRRIMEWAEDHGYANRIEVLSFVDKKASVDWMTEAGCKRMNLLTKGSLHHCKNQLRKTLQEHLADIAETIEYAKSKDVNVCIYLEDWSNGMINSPDYVFEMIEALFAMPVDRIHPCDTLGILSPIQVHDFLKSLGEKFPLDRMEFHGHNDYGLATANCLVAANLGIGGLHVTVNGLGERAGNAAIAEVVATLNDHSTRSTNIDETKFKEVSRLVEAFSGKRIAANAPIIGTDVFTQTAGIHADGDKKGNLYESRLTPSRFARSRVYALGKLSGRSNLDFNLDQLDMDLTPEQRKAVLQRVVELGDQKKVVTTEDLPFIINDLFSTQEEKEFEVLGCVVTSTLNLSPAANVKVRFKSEDYQAVGQGNGGYDAFMNALRQITPQIGINLPKLLDFEIHIPPGGRTNALVEATITWEGGMKTRAVSSDQVLASIKATERMINLMLKRGIVIAESGSESREDVPLPQADTGA